MHLTWKRLFVLIIVVGALYGGCNTQSILVADDFFREEQPDLALTPTMCHLLATGPYITFRYALAADIYERNIKDFPYQSNTVKAELRRARCFEKLGDRGKAIELYEDFLVRHPRYDRYRSVVNRIATLKATG
jgi:tetratricopeptide (TPR) repeat protein